MMSKGSGGTSNKKKEDGVIDQEQQFVLRLPPGPAAMLRQDIQSGSLNLKDKLSIELAPDSRYGKLTYEGYVFNTKLVDLPCIIESLKTTDRKTLYKTADICQMLMCTNDDEEIPIEVESPKKKDKDKRYLWNHGICPSLKNCRKKRFRRVLTKKYQEQPDTEKEVKRLFRMDNEAVDIKWEIVVEDDKAADTAAGSSAAAAASDTSRDADERPIKNIPGLVDIFGDVSSSDDDADDDDDDDDNMKEEEQENTASQAMMDNSDSQLPGLKNNLVEVVRDLEELKERRLRIEDEMSSVDSQSIKERLQIELNELTEEESQKQQDYEILSSMMNE